MNNYGIRSLLILTFICAVLILPFVNMHLSDKGSLKYLYLFIHLLIILSISFVLRSILFNTFIKNIRQAGVQVHNISMENKWVSYMLLFIILTIYFITLFVDHDYLPYCLIIAMTAMTERTILLVENNNAVWYYNDYSFRFEEITHYKLIDERSLLIQYGPNNKVIRFSKKKAHLKAKVIHTLQQYGVQ